MQKLADCPQALNALSVTVRYRTEETVSESYTCLGEMIKSCLHSLSPLLPLLHNMIDNFHSMTSSISRDREGPLWKWNPEAQAASRGPYVIEFIKAKLWRKCARIIYQIHEFNQHLNDKSHKSSRSLTFMLIRGLQAGHLVDPSGGTRAPMLLPLLLFWEKTTC